MNEEVWRRIEELYHAALELPAHERAAFLSHACSGDAQLLGEVESLLAHEGKADGLLEGPALTQVLVGQVISHYRVTGKLGEGGMGEVWKAHDTELDRSVALKTLPVEMAADASRRSRFVQEARSASALNHPNIITIHDIVHEDGARYLVMEFVDGKSLDQLIPKKGMRLNDALKYAIQISSALAAAHKIGIVHRDLKPANVMVTPAGVVKVLDFGLAKMVEPAALPNNDPTHSVRALTEQGIIVGTLNYMSPEQAEGRTVDTCSDIFSFGSVLYEMISGERAFQRESRISTLSAVITEEPKPLTNAPPELVKLVARCLRKDPEQRMQHMADIMLMLEEIKAEGESARSATGGKLGRKWLRPAAVGLLLVFAAGGVYLYRQSPATEALPLRAVPITSYPGSETEPSLSPDGNTVAFSWNGENRDNADIYVKLVSGGPALRLTTNRARDRLPRWSPDGRQIAFLRSDTADKAGESIMLISPLGGPERKLAQSLSSVPWNMGLAWTPDAKSLAFADQMSPTDGRYSIFLISLETGERRQLTAPTPEASADLSFSFSPDGGRLAFARYGSSTADLYLLNVAGNEIPRRISTAIDKVGTIAWTPSGDEIIYSSGGVLWRCKAKTPTEPPVSVSGADGPATDPVASLTGRLVYTRTTFDSNVWKLDLSQRGAKPAQVVASTYVDEFPHLSPDFSSLVFASNRSGYLEIWVSDSKGANPVQLTFLRGSTHSPKWSPDGKQIAFSAIVEGKRNIYVMDASGGSLRRLTKGQYASGRPSWSRDSKFIYFYSNAAGRQEIWKMPASGGADVQITSGGAHSGEESLDGTTFFYSKFDDAGIYRRDRSGGQDELMVKRTVPGWWSVCDQGIYFAEIPGGGEFQDPPTLIKFWNYATRKISEVTLIEKPINLPSVGLSASRDGKILVWAQIDHMDSDLMLVENFR